MIPCPSSDTLRSLLDESLVEEIRKQVSAHIESCDNCQETLLEISSDTDLALDSKGNSNSTPFLDSLCEKDPDRLLDEYWLKCLVPSSNASELGVLGRYAILSKLGSGGMGIVFRARDRELNRQVALKVVRPSLDSNLTVAQRNELLVRFRREAEYASSLNHPNIVTIHEIGEIESLHFFAMEFVEGQTLSRLMPFVRTDPAKILSISVQICEALVLAHSRQILHRDLKPENVMVRPDGLVKVLDFGLARHTSDLGSLWTPLSTPGALIGTVDYMSPEQARGSELDTKSDIFGLGILLYQMVLGKHPFISDSNADTLAAILSKEPVFEIAAEDSWRNELKPIIEACLQKESHLRPTAMEVRDALAILENRPSNNTDHAGVGSAATLLPQVDATQDQSEDEQQPSGVRYALSGEVNIAWQCIGEGPLDIVFVMGWVSHLDWFWKDPSFAAFLRRLSKLGRVILFDKRGTGLSDKVPIDQLPTLEDRMDDVRAVMEAAKSEQAVLLGVSEGGPLCALFAATYPDKTMALVMNGSYARRLWSEDYPWGPTEEQRNQFLDLIKSDWGGPIGIEDRAPSKANDPEFREWWASYLRMGASPGAALALTRMNAAIDVRGVLPSIQVPTLVIHRQGDKCLLVDEGQYLADSIPGAKFVALPGEDHLPFVGDVDSLMHEVEIFLSVQANFAEADRVLATVVCIIGAEPFSPELQEDLNRQAKVFRSTNQEIQTNKCLLTFDGPIRAVRAAASVMANGELRIGIDTGVCDITSAGIRGPGVDQANKVAEAAPLGDTWVTDGVRNLTSGSGLKFEALSEAGAGSEQGKLFRLATI